MLDYLKRRGYKVRWVIGETACYAYKNAKGNFVNANIMSLFDYKLLGVIKDA